MTDLSETKAQILAFLDRYHIPYQYYEHERAHTIEQCAQLPFITDDIMMCKNILLCNRQKTVFYLMLLCPETPFRTAVVSKSLGVSRLSFAPEDALSDKMHLTSGSVSPLGLMYDRFHEITLCYEPDIRKPKQIAFHPCDNSATLVFEQEIFWSKVLPQLGVQPVEAACHD